MKFVIRGVVAIVGYVLGVAFGILLGAVVDAHYPLTYAPHIATPTGIFTALLFYLFADQMFQEYEDRIRCYVEERHTMDGISEFYVVIMRGKRFMSSRAYTIRGRAEYDCAECNHVLNNFRKPNPDTYRLDSN